MRSVCRTKNEEALYLLGTAYEDLGQLAKASSAYEKALEIDPDFKDALHDLSIVYMSEGRSDNARALLPKLASVDPGWGKELRTLLSRMK